MAHVPWAQLYGMASAVVLGAFVRSLMEVFCRALACSMNYVDGQDDDDDDTGASTIRCVCVCVSHLLHFGFLTDC